MGRFTLKDSICYNKNESYNKYIIPLNGVLSYYPHLLVNMETANGIRNGKQIRESEVINMDNIMKRYGRDRLPGIFPVFDQEKNLLAMVHTENRSIADGNMKFRLLRVMV